MNISSDESTFELRIALVDPTRAVPHWRQHVVDFVRSLGFEAIVDELIDGVDVSVEGFDSESESGAPIAIYDVDNVLLYELGERVRMRFSEVFDVTFEVRAIDQTGWQQAWNAEESSFVAEPFSIRFADELSTDDGFIPIVLQRGRSFGNGQHATTRACLLALGRLFETNKWKSVADIGTGNGILAVAAQKLAQSACVVGTDLDEEIIAEARANVSLNQCNAWVSVSDKVPNGTYDLVLCNILLPELLRLLPEMVNAVRDLGHFVAAGFLQSDDKALLERAGNFGLIESFRCVENGWAAIVFHKAALN